MSAKELKGARPGQTSAEVLLEALRSGYADRDVGKVMSAYAEHVECTIVNRNNPPSRPLLLRGHAALRAMIGDICSREMTHGIRDVVSGEGSLAYRVECSYPDGCKVVGIYMATVKDGLIVREVSVDCWDE